jgi:hypothetical protein
LLKIVYPLVKVVLPAPGQPVPVPAGRGAASWQPGESGADVGQRDARPVRDADERYPAEHVTAVASLVAGGAPAADQALPLVEMQCRYGHAAASGEFANREFPSVPPRLIQCRLASVPRFDLNDSSGLTVVLYRRSGTPVTGTAHKGIFMADRGVILVTGATGNR